MNVQWCTGASRGRWEVALESGEAASERCLELRWEEDPQLGDDASCDELVRRHVKRRVPHLDTCSQEMMVVILMFLNGAYN